MAKRCTRCGNFLMDDERFCTRCGENVSVIPPVVAAPDTGAAQAQAPVAAQPPVQGQAAGGYNGGYTANHAQAGVPGNAPYVYTQPATLHEEMTVGKWLLTIILTTFFGIISIVALFIWAFGDGPESRKNYCKAMLIVQLIGFVLGIILMIVWIGFIAVYSDDIIRFFNENMSDIENGLEQFAETAAIHIFHF